MTWVILGIAVAWVFFGVTMAAVVAIIAQSKGRPASGWFFFGLVFWPIALVCILVAESKKPTKPQRVIIEATADAVEEFEPCPFCAEPIRAAAKVCRFCNRDLPEEWSAPVALPAAPTTSEHGAASPNTTSPRIA